MKEFNNIKMTKLSSNTQALNELKKGKYIVFADNMPLQYGIDILTQDILYYDKRNKRFRFMLAKNWTSDKLIIYPITGVIPRGGINGYYEMCKIGNLDFNNYDVVYSVDKKYIEVILDNYKDSPL